MNANAIIGITAALVGCVVGVIIYMQTTSGDSSYLAKSKWELTLAATDDYDETPQTWYVDTANGAISIHSNDGVGGTRVEEFVNGQKFTYQMSDPEQNQEMDMDAFCAQVDSDTYDGDCAVLAAEVVADALTLEEQMAGSKSSCTSEAFDVTIEQVTITENGNVAVGGFNVKMVDGLPTAILDGEDSTVVVATINSIEEWADDLDISGCSDDGSDDRRILGMLEAIGESRRRRTTEGEVDAEVQTARDHLNDIYMGMLAKTEAGTELTDQAARHLGGDWQQWVTNTDWCGVSDTRATAPCPGAEGMTGGYDDNAACHRHDHGSHWKMILGGIVAVLTCDNDKALTENSGHWAVQAINGKFGFAGWSWGCLDYGTYDCWTWKPMWWGGYWRYGGYCTGEFTKMGPWRFDNIQHNYGWVHQLTGKSHLVFGQSWGEGEPRAGWSMCDTKFTKTDTDGFTEIWI